MDLGLSLVKKIQIVLFHVVPYPRPTAQIVAIEAIKKIACLKTLTSVTPAGPIVCWSICFLGSRPSQWFRVGVVAQRLETSLGRKDLLPASRTTTT
jgi:hypothetical protein